MKLSFENIFLIVIIINILSITYFKTKFQPWSVFMPSYDEIPGR